MNRVTAILLATLVALNLAGTGYLLLAQAPPWGRGSDSVTGPELVQLDKLFQLTKDFRTELESVAERTTYPSDKEKTSAYRYLQGYQFAFEMARLQLKTVHAERSQPAALVFVKMCWGTDTFFNNGIALTEVPKWIFGPYNNSRESYDQYPNASVTRLESLDTEFRVLALSLLKDLR